MKNTSQNNQDRPGAPPNQDDQQDPLNDPEKPLNWQPNNGPETKPDQGQEQPPKPASTFPPPGPTEEKLRKMLSPEDNSAKEVFREQMGLNITDEEWQKSFAKIREELTDDKVKANHIGHIKLGKRGLFQTHFEKYPIWQRDFEVYLVPMREKLMAELGTITMAQSIILDLFIITYYKIMTLEQGYGGLETMMQNFPPDDVYDEGFLGYMEAHLERLYRRMGLLLEMLAKTSRDGNKIKIKAASFQVQVDRHNLSGMDRE